MTNRTNIDIIAIGASTGGTEATVQILKDLPADIPGMVITQHMPEGFTRMYAERLNKLCAFEVREARDGDAITSGLALLAPGGRTHMTIVRIGDRFFIRLFKGDKVNGHRPSVDILFDSVARSAGKNAIGIILTGMGNDGAQGLLHMRKAGAYTIGQNEASSVVYGMPMVAYEKGAVCTRTGLENIAGLIIRHTK
ncbi:chemotaxis response regulator CheB [Aequitasia blattaphilus]|uniref:CheB methylesterase domain-containing protein n=1 Tax=Aequitasia blattaphilus TaxID=2949332 RepID=UPI002916A012|nr:CheB methylesterase domain-containing protein [Aequitasia blattaphilus]